MNLLVDHRERSDLAAMLGAAGWRIEYDQLAHGDYVIERKRADDFIASIVDGRLFRQVAGMKKRALGPILLIEGDPIVLVSKPNDE